MSSASTASSFPPMLLAEITKNTHPLRKWELTSIICTRSKLHWPSFSSLTVIPLRIALPQVLRSIGLGGFSAEKRRNSKKMLGCSVNRVASFRSTTRKFEVKFLSLTKIVPSSLTGSILYLYADLGAMKLRRVNLLMFSI